MLGPVSGTSVIKSNENVYKLAELFEEKYKNSNITEEEFQNHVSCVVDNIIANSSSYDEESYCSPLLKYFADVLNGMRWLSVIYILIYICISPITIGVGLFMVSASFSFSLFFMMVLFTVPFMVSIFGVIFIPSDRDDIIDLLMDVFSRLNGGEDNKNEK